MGDNTSSTNNSWPKYNVAYDKTWRLISEKVNYLLKRGPQSSITFEPLYSHIYRTVCSGNSEKLYTDLMSLVSTHLDEVDKTLGDADEVSFEHFVGVSNAMRDFIDCSKKMTLVFSYFNKKYVFHVLSTDLFLELAEMFTRTILEPRMPALMIVAEEALQVPCSYSPTIFHHFCSDVWTVCNRTYAVKYPRIFSRYHLRNCPELKPSDTETHRPEILEFEEKVRERLTARANREIESLLVEGTTH